MNGECVNEKCGFGRSPASKPNCNKYKDESSQTEILSGISPFMSSSNNKFRRESEETINEWPMSARFEWVQTKNGNWRAIRWIWKFGFRTLCKCVCRRWKKMVHDFRCPSSSILHTIGCVWMGPNGRLNGVKSELWLRRVFHLFALARAIANRSNRKQHLCVSVHVAGSMAAVRRSTCTWNGITVAKCRHTRD